MKYLITTTLIFISFINYAQELRLSFKAQGYEDEVRMFWQPIEWPSNVDGINVKRKTNDEGNWVKLNLNPIQPSTESIDNVSNNQIMVNRLKSKRDSLLSIGKLRSATFETVKDEIFTDSTATQFFGYAAEYEFEQGLIFGLGFYDQNIPSATSYTYGIFPIIDGIEVETPLETYEWQYGSKPDISLNYSSDIQKIRKRKGIEVTWKVPTIEVLNKKIKGFHIYQEDTLGQVNKLTKNLIRINKNNLEQIVSHYDPNYNTNQRTKFYVVAVDLFDYNSEKDIIDFLPNNYASLVSPILLIEENNEIPQINVSWQFDERNNGNIEGFSIYRRQNVEEESEEISQLTPTERSFQDFSVQSNGYYFYKIGARLNTGAILYSAEKLIYKNYVIALPTPRNLTGKLTKQNGQKFIELLWQPNSPIDTLISGYQLFVESSTKIGLSQQGSIPLITDNFYQFPVRNLHGKRYRFAIRAVSTNNVKSALSDTITVYSPTEELPFFNVWPVSKSGKIVTLNWKFANNIDDLSGFNLYQNGELILTPNELNANVRQWVSNELEPGKYVYQLEAVTQFGVKSRKTTRKSFTITE